MDEGLMMLFCLMRLHSLASEFAVHLLSFGLTRFSDRPIPIFYSSPSIYVVFFRVKELEFGEKNEENKWISEQLSVVSFNPDNWCPYAFHSTDKIANTNKKCVRFWSMNSIFFENRSYNHVPIFTYRVHAEEVLLNKELSKCFQVIICFKWPRFCSCCCCYTKCI